MQGKSPAQTIRQWAYRWARREQRKRTTEQELAAGKISQGQYSARLFAMINNREAECFQMLPAYREHFRRLGFNFPMMFNPQNQPGQELATCYSAVWAEDSLFIVTENSLVYYFPALSRIQIFDNETEQWLEVNGRERRSLDYLVYEIAQTLNLDFNRAHVRPKTSRTQRKQ